MIFFDQFKVPTIKFGKCFAEFMIPIAKGKAYVGLCYYDCLFKGKANVGLRYYDYSKVKLMLVSVIMTIQR